MRRLRSGILASTVLIFAGWFAVRAAAQEPPQLPPEASAPPPPSSTSSSKPQNSKKYSHADDFLILGTVFTDKGYAFPGIEIRVRRTNEKKFRWDTYANSRGEFAIRVPKGTDYEMLIRAKGFLDQTKGLDAKSGLSETRLVFRMEPGKEGKK